MLKLCRVTKVKVLFLALVYGFNFNLFESSAVILEKGLLRQCECERYNERCAAGTTDVNDGPKNVRNFPATIV